MKTSAVIACGFVSALVVSGVVLGSDVISQPRFAQAHSGAREDAAGDATAFARSDSRQQIYAAFLSDDSDSRSSSGGQPLTQREILDRLYIAAYADPGATKSLGEAYERGRRGLIKNEDLGRCLLAVNPGNGLHDGVEGCFTRFDYLARQLAQQSHTLNGPDCSTCDAPSIPPIGRAALSLTQGDAYAAVDSLRPFASGGNLGAQISIAFITQDRLNGARTGDSEDPFTWRESWAWWHVAASRSVMMANMLGGFYLNGYTGLPKNEKLGECLQIGDIQRESEYVRSCFERYGSHGPILR